MPGRLFFICCCFALAPLWFVVHPDTVEAVNITIKGDPSKEGVPPYGPVTVDKIYETHDPGVPPQNASFPLVLYLVGTPYDSAFGPPLNGYPAPEISGQTFTVPEYVGYVVIDADYRLTFVNKTKFPLNLAKVVDHYNAKPKNGRAVLGVNGDEGLANFGWFSNTDKTLWLPRWSWNFIEEFAGELDFQNRYSRTYMTMGVPPDDTFVPKFAKTWNFTGQELQDGLWFGSGYAINMFENNYQILNSPHNGTAPVQGWNDAFPWVEPDKTP